MIPFDEDANHLAHFAGHLPPPFGGVGRSGVAAGFIINASLYPAIVVIVGLPDPAVKESRDRVTTALTNSGFKFPMGWTTINLAPAGIKEGRPRFRSANRNRHACGQ